MYEARLVRSYYPEADLPQVSKVNNGISHTLSNHVCTVSTYSYYVSKSLKELKSHGDMLEWLTGSAQPADAHFARADNGESYIEEPPETPAPLFAVRAFKTAIFGTPHPDQSVAKRPAQQKEVAKTQPAGDVEDSQVHDAVNDYFSEPAAVLKVGPMASPTKGILLTPGTGATRRKTVSFGNLMANAPKEEVHSPSTEAATLKSRKNQDVPEASPKIQPRHSSLTKTLIELSKQKPNSQATSVTSDELGPTKASASIINAQMDSTDQAADTTVDLSQPCSRSGQHWKTEYEKYHKKSNREMKKVIMCGQNVKSYAVKKDSEATGLGEKLKKELAKVAAMEKKVSKLAAQLKIAHAQGPEEESEQTRLVSELAQQTALAIRYKQKADHYKRAIQKENRADGSAIEREDMLIMEEAGEWSSREADSPEVVARSAGEDVLHAQLGSLRTIARKAEDQAAKLEAENDALKRSLARVKGEMMSYESRRQAREERFKRREAKCKADQKACEAQLAKLTVEHQKLLLVTGQSSEVEAPAHLQPNACYDHPSGLDGTAKSAERVPASVTKINDEALGHNRVSKPYTSPRKSRLQNSVVDIWTFSSPREAAENASPSKEPTELPPSSVRQDIKRTLKEIDMNLIPEQQPSTESNSEAHLSQINSAHKPPTKPIPQHQPGLSSPAPQTHNRRPKIDSPRPSMVDLTSSPAKVESSEAVLKPFIKNSSIATLGRSSSLMSRVGSRTSTMTSGRGSALPAERAAAAKARLAARSAEKRSRGK